jgi:hypothetical protein
MQILFHCIHPRRLQWQACKNQIHHSAVSWARTPYSTKRTTSVSKPTASARQAYSFTPYSNTSCCCVPGGKTRSKVNPSLSGPELSCAERICTVVRLSSNATTVSPPSRVSFELGGRNLYYGVIKADCQRACTRRCYQNSRTDRQP